MADLVVQGKPAEQLLDKMAGGTKASTVQRSTVQRDASKKLTDGQRMLMISEIGDRMGIAYTKYCGAASDHGAKLKKAADAERDMIMLIADIALGFVAPGMGGRLVKLLDKVPVKAPDVVYKAAIRMMGNADQVVAAATTVGKDSAKKALDGALARTEGEKFLEHLNDHFASASIGGPGGVQTHKSESYGFVCWVDKDLAPTALARSKAKWKSAKQEFDHTEIKGVKW